VPEHPGIVDSILQHSHTQRQPINCNCDPCAPYFPLASINVTNAVKIIQIAFPNQIYPFVRRYCRHAANFDWYSLGEIILSYLAFLEGEIYLLCISGIFGQAQVLQVQQNIARTDQSKNLLKSSTPMVSPAPLYVEHNVLSGISATLFPAQNCMTIPMNRIMDPTTACEKVSTVNRLRRKSRR
jgi:hypothetical protein